MNDKKTKSPAARDEGAVLLRRAHAWPFRLLMRAALLFAVAAILLPVPLTLAQLPIGGNATDFNSVKYYGAPYQQEIECLFSGTEAQPIAGGLLLVKNVKLKTFDLNGKLQLVAEAPECIYDPVNAVANSPGAVHVRNGDDSLTMDGEGFLWRQREYLFTISNRVDTLFTISNRADAVFDKMPARKR